MNNSDYKPKGDKKTIFRFTNPENPYLEKIKQIIPTSNLGYKFKGDKKTTFYSKDADLNSSDYSKYLKKIPQLIDIGYNQKWLYAVATNRPAGIKSAIEYLIIKQNDIIKLNNIDIDSGKMMRVYKSKYPYITTELLANNIDILQKTQVKTRNIFLDNILTAGKIREIKQYFERLNQKYNKETQSNQAYEACTEYDDNKSPLLSNSKDPVLTEATLNCYSFFNDK